MEMTLEPWTLDQNGRIYPNTLSRDAVFYPIIERTPEQEAQYWADVEERKQFWKWEEENPVISNLAWILRGIVPVLENLTGSEIPFPYKNKE